VTDGRSADGQTDGQDRYAACKDGRIIMPYMTMTRDELCINQQTVV